jgi:hypothetical protein
MESNIQPLNILGDNVKFDYSYSVYKIQNELNDSILNSAEKLSANCIDNPSHRVRFMLNIMEFHYKFLERLSELSNSFYGIHFNHAKDGTCKMEHTRPIMNEYIAIKMQRLIIMSFPINPN